MAVKTVLRGGGSMTRVDLTKAQCAELANYLRGVLNNGMGAGSFDKLEMLVLARRALAAAEELPEASSVSTHAPAARKPQAEDASAAGSPASEAAQLKRFPVAIWREVAAALDKIERKKGADTDGKDN